MEIPERNLGEAQLEFERGLAMDLCTPNSRQTQTQDRPKSTSTLLQTNLNECNDLLVS
jgi:hypothetical protein